MAAKRKLIWLGAALAILLLCAAAVWFLWPAGPSITVETYERLRPGMSRSEVEGMLGGPGGTRQGFVLWMDNRTCFMGPGEDLLNENREQPGIKYWYHDTGIVVVRFDDDDCVAAKQFLSVPESSRRQRLRKLREWFGW
jgi:hypothetical protein